MKTYTGKTYIGEIVKSDLEGGVWLLKSDHGVMYQLDGGDRGLRRDGQRVEIEGELASDTVGIAMVGEVLRVDRYRVIS